MSNNLADVKVEIILPNYNSELYLSETIDSIINQTFKNWKLTIVDDNSNIETQRILKNYMNHPNINIIKLKKKKSRFLQKSCNEKFPIRLYCFY